MTHELFQIGFDRRDKERVFEYWDEIFTSQKWAEGRFTALFEEKWAKWNRLSAVSTSSWAGAAPLAAIHEWRLLNHYFYFQT